MRVRDRVAALAVGAVVVGGSALVGAGVGNAATASLTLVYTCPFPLIGDQEMSVHIEVADLPDSAVVNQPTPATTVTATATVPATATEGLALVGAATVEGTARATTRADNAGTVYDINADLTVGLTTVPASGPFDTVATGGTPPVAFPAAGFTTIDVGDFEVTLTPRKADGSETGLGTFVSPCTLLPGQATRLHEFTVEGGTTTGPTTTTTTDISTTEPTTTTTPTGGSGTTTTTASGGGTTTTGTSATSTTTSTQAVVPVGYPDQGGKLAYTGAEVKGALLLAGALLAMGVGTFYHLRRARRRA
ncbi:DUF6801 domain-containing protein [Actinosynnema sp. NPDC059335]|uniref:DUF6801 domain-containing protein n=1 Tax=Actinosynnema sp. NPDC059335 TaxID=3346804 RepID=UPI00366A55F3